MLSNLHLNTSATTKDSNSLFTLGLIIEPESFRKLPRTLLHDCTQHNNKQYPTKKQTNPPWRGPSA
ncbi:hypothetical protein N7447_009303 [Penicillium robsamsonii]|uniref:uncharacterized protein n=1 Tax=Penicillium robsamsonii TaxID=1792511 RepID=UPI0025477806|nr:uncharacterized protein N7447_009303 [Penicillium robsamsonii]KAJ5817070.1 hypothetical protein N7447_009303 [Penicillium robsamsonii]